MSSPKRRTSSWLTLEGLAGSPVAASLRRFAPLMGDVLEVRIVPAYFFTNTSVAASPNPATTAQTVTLTATVTVPFPGISYPMPLDGEVRFYIDGVNLGTSRTGTDGIATIQPALTTISTGSKTVRAVFAGAGNFFDYYDYSEGSSSFQLNAVAPPPAVVTPSPVVVATPVVVAAPVVAAAPVIAVAPPVVVPLPPVVPQQRILVGGDAGTTPTVRSFFSDGTLAKELLAFDPGFLGGVRVGTGDVTGDGIPDIFVAAGPGGAPMVRAFNGETLAMLWEKPVFEESFRGGVYLSVGDVTGDGRPDVIVTPDQGGGPVVKILDGSTGGDLSVFFGIDDPTFRGGARASLGDVNGDTRFDLIVSAGFGGGPRIAVYNGTQLMNVQGSIPPRLMDDFFAFEDTLRNGAFVAAGDVNGDGYADLIFGAGPGGGPRVLGLDAFGMMTRTGLASSTLFDFFAGSTDIRGGVFVCSGDVDGDGIADILTSTFGGELNLFNGKDRKPLTVADRIKQFANKGGSQLTVTPAKGLGGKNGPLDYLPPGFSNGDSTATGATTDLPPIDDGRPKSVGNPIPVGDFTGVFNGGTVVTLTGKSGRQVALPLKLTLTLSNQQLMTGGGSVRFDGQLTYTLTTYNDYGPEVQAIVGNIATDSSEIDAEGLLGIDGRTLADGSKIRDFTNGGSLTETASANAEGYRVSATLASLDARPGIGGVTLSNIVVNFISGPLQTVSFTIPYLALGKRN